MITKKKDLIILIAEWLLVQESSIKKSKQLHGIKCGESKKALERVGLFDLLIRKRMN